MGVMEALEQASDSEVEEGLPLELRAEPILEPKHECEPLLSSIGQHNLLGDAIGLTAAFSQVHDQ